MATLDSSIRRELKLIKKRFKSIDKRVNRSVLLPAMKQGIKPIYKRAQANAKWGDIKKLISKKSFISKKGNVIGKVFLKESMRSMKIDGRTVGFEVVGKILEFGRAARGDAGGNKVVAPVPFMRSARKQARRSSISEFNKKAKARFKKLKIK